jgi:translation initiation factor 2 beta subunit (eIF-2beta)/eIF-5
MGEAMKMSSHAERFRYYANAYGECDTCHTPDVPVYREDSDEGWQECERCDAARELRRVRRALARKAARP